MRLALIVSMLALGSVAVLDATGRSVRWARHAQARRAGLPAHSVRRGGAAGGPSNGSTSKDRDEEAAQPTPTQQQQHDGKSADADAAACCHISATAAAAAAAAAKAKATPAAASSSGEEQPVQAAIAPATALAAPRSGLAWQQQASFLQQGSSRVRQGGGAWGGGTPGFLPGDHPPPRPELALRRGLSRRVRDASGTRPRLVRYGALALVTVSFSSAYCCQIVAPGYVDPSIGGRAGGRAVCL